MIICGMSIISLLRLCKGMIFGSFFQDDGIFLYFCVLDTNEQDIM